jgi:hypothetical protein
MKLASKDIKKNQDVARLVQQATSGAIKFAQRASSLIETTLDRPVLKLTVSRALHAADLHAKKKLFNPLWQTFTKD